MSPGNTAPQDRKNPWLRYAGWSLAASTLAFVVSATIEDVEWPGPDWLHEIVIVAGWLMGISAVLAAILVVEKALRRQNRSAWGSWRDWRVFIEYLLVGIGIPALIYWLIERTTHVETDNQEMLLTVLGLGGTGAFFWWRSRF